MTGTYKKERFDTQAHRGGRGLMPENTVASMMNALAFGVATLEMDVVITKDKKVILSHEPFFNTEITTKPDGSFVKPEEEKELNIYKMDFADVLKYDVGLKPHPRFAKQEKTAATKPLLSDVFDAVKKYMAEAKRPYPFFNIETKSQPASDNSYHPEPAAFVELLMDVIKSYDLEKQVIIQSFDFRTLQYLHQKYPHIKTAMLVEADDKRSFRKQLDDLGFTPTIHSPAYELVTDNLIAECHEKNIRIIPWTVNDKASFDKLKNMGVDGIITDYPDLNNIRF
ncbi:MAG: glycerophosphodiester phosphodiesterase [Rhizobacter sp.]|nr:glycerophosphodiester phosphodiesterase [Ferruginibacter sp.]